jgi:hypothetical protein
MFLLKPVKTIKNTNICGLCHKMTTENSNFFVLKSCNFYCGEIYNGFLQFFNLFNSKICKKNLQKFEKSFLGCFKAPLEGKFTVRLQHVEHPNKLLLKHT